MSKKILLITQYFLPDINAASYRMNDLYSAMKKLDYDVTVVTSYPQKSAVESIQKDINVHRLTLNKVQKKSFINYLKNYFGFMFKSFFHSVFRLGNKKYDYTIVTSPPLFVALGGVLISFLKRTKFILDIRDIWPDSAVGAGMLKDNGIIYRITKVLEKFIYKRADIITCVSEPMKNYIYLRSNHPSIHVLYNGISPSSIQLDNAFSVETKQKESNKIIIGYAGNIGIVQNIDTLIKAADYLNKIESQRFEFLIIGDGIERERLEEEVHRLQLDNVKFTGVMSKEDTFKTLETVDLLFFSLVDNPIFETTIPSKLFDYLLCNKPIITSVKGEGRTILQKLGCGLFFEAEDPKSLGKSLMAYKENKAFYDNASLSNYDYVCQNFNREKMFISFLESI